MKVRKQLVGGCGDIFIVGIITSEVGGMPMPFVETLKQCTVCTRSQITPLHQKLRSMDKMYVCLCLPRIAGGVVECVQMSPQSVPCWFVFSHYRLIGLCIMQSPFVKFIHACSEPQAKGWIHPIKTPSALRETHVFRLPPSPLSL